MHYSFKGDLKKIRRRLKQHQQKCVVPAARTATNKTMSHFKKVSARKLKGELGLPIKTINGRLKISKAKGKDLRATLYALTAPVRVTDLKYSKSKRGVRSSGRSFAHSFVATLQSGKVGVFNRKGKARLPIEHTKIEIYTQAKARLDSEFKQSRTVFINEFRKELARRLERLPK